MIPYPRITCECEINVAPISAVSVKIMDGKDFPQRVEFFFIAQSLC